MIKKILYLLIILVGLSSQLCHVSAFSPEVEVKKLWEGDAAEIILSGSWNEEQEYYQAYSWIDLAGGRLTLGKKQESITHGEFSGLLLGPQSPPLNMIKYESTHQIFPEELEFDSTQMVAFLGEDVNKTLFIHRISNDTYYPNLELGLSEARMAHKHLHPAYYMPVAGWPYYFTKWLLGYSSTYANYADHYVGVDFKYQLPGKGELYGELLVNEYPMYAHATNPDKRAHLLGIFYSLRNDLDFRAEYSNVFNTFYVHRHPENSYTYKGEALGHWLGPDAEQIDLELSYYLNQDNGEDIELKGGLRRIKKGIGDFDIDYNHYDDFEEKKFLSEVTEEKILLRGEALFHFGNSNSLKVQVELEDFYSKNLSISNLSLNFLINL